MKIALFIGVVLLSFTVRSQNLARLNVKQDQTNTTKIDEGFKPISYGYSIDGLNRSLELSQERHKLETVGRNLLFIGLPVALGGYAMASSGSSDSPGNILGGALFTLGVLSITSGAIIWPIGRSLRE